MRRKRTNRKPDEKLPFKKILPILVVVLVDILGLAIFFPLLPLYATSFGANAFWIGLLGAMYPLMQFVGAPILGNLSDQFGRRNILIISQIGTLIGFVVMALAGSLPILFLARIIDGISGGNISTAQAAITDRTTEKTRTAGLGLIGAAFGIGFTFGPALAALVLALTEQNYRAVAWVAAGFSLLSILLSFFWLEESLPPEKRGKKGKKSQGLKAIMNGLRHPALGFLLLLMFAQQFVFGGFERFLSYFTLSRLGLNGGQNGLIFAFIGIIAIIIQGGLIGKLSNRLGDRGLILMGLISLGFALVMMAVTPKQPPPFYDRAQLVESLTDVENSAESATALLDKANIDLPDETNKGWLGIGWLMIAMIPAAIGGSVLRPAISSLITKQVDSHEVGGVLGTTTAFTSMANTLAPLFLGTLFSFFGSTVPFAIGGLILLMLWVVARKKLVG